MKRKEPPTATAAYEAAEREFLAKFDELPAETRLSLQLGFSNGWSQGGMDGYRRGRAQAQLAMRTVLGLHDTEPEK